MNARRAGRAVGCLFSVGFAVAVLAAAGAAWVVSVRSPPFAVASARLGDAASILALAWFLALLVVFSRLLDYLWKLLGLVLTLRVDRNARDSASDAFVRALFVESSWGSRRRRLI